ncbi:4188_t:CDS:2, partial [Funneliformis caledonium]
TKKDNITPISLVNFVNDEGNILLAVSSELSENIRHKAGTVPLLTKILWANDTAYSCDFELLEQEPLAIGNDVGLISGYKQEIMQELHS